LTAGGISILSSIDDLQEFKVLTYNYSAEYGTRAGPTVLLTTKSGTNDFHGSLYEFLRNTALDAKSFFAPSAEKFNLNQFGGSIGGPIKKGKTFFFVDGEQKYQRHGITFTGLVPSEAMRNGDFSADPFGAPVSGLLISNPNMVGASTDPNAYPNIYFQCDAGGNPTALVPGGGGRQVQGTACNQIPTALFNNIGQAMMNLYPAPNANNPASGFNFVDSPVRKLDETKFDIRLDHTFSSADSAFSRFSYDQAVSYVPGGGPGFAEANAFGSNQGIINHARNVAIGETHVFSPTTVNQATFGYNRIFDYITSQGTGTCASATIVPGGIPGANLGCPNGSSTCVGGSYSCGLTSTIVFGGFWAIGDRGFSPFQGGTNIFSFNDSLDVIRGKHDIKVGLGFRANQMNVGTQGFQDGFWIIGNGGYFSGFTDKSTDPATVITPGNAAADFLLGITGLAIHDQSFNGPVTGRRWKIYRPFVQDDWRVSKNLTLNLGVAWDVTTPITEVANRQSDYIPETGQVLVAGQDGNGPSAGIHTNWTAFEPRIGLAYKLFGGDKTVVRAGYSIYHDSAWSMGAQGLWQNPPFYAESDAFTGAGCAFVTSYCHTALGQAPSAISLSDGFPVFSGPPDPASFTGAWNTTPRDVKLGRVQQFNVNVERQLPGQVVLTVGYAGSRGGHLLMYGDNLNTTSPSACGTVSGYTLGCNPDGSPYFPFNTFNTIYIMSDYGKTTYNSLQVKAETKSTRYGLYALLGYTYSKTYDNGLSDGLGSVLSAPYFPLPNWEKLDWALSQIDLSNSFTASVVYDLPFGRGKKFGHDWNGVTNSLLGGWQATLIEKITSGFPVPLINSTNSAGNFFQNGGNGNNWNRPDQAAGCDPYNASHSQLQYINASCFVAAPTGQLGNASRVPVTGPDFVNTDFSVIKRFALPRESMGLDFRAEIFNLFNHAQFGPPVNDVSAPGFGSVNSTVNNPRLVQFGLKLTF
jgi:hypothetical protein